MVQSLPIPPPGFDALTVEEQIDYIQSLWDHLASMKDTEAEEWHNLSAERLRDGYDDEEEEYPY